ncbi:MAG: glycosyltransferase [Eubacterium sp.]|nr:glycosyltransferase [Eubacterium sp.]
MIIFCKNAVETLSYFSAQLAEAFAAWGYEIFWFDMQMAGLSAWKLRQAVQQTKKEAVLLTFNFIGLSGEEELWELDDLGKPQISLWEKLDISCLNIMVDHPVYYDKALKYRFPAVRMFCVDRGHVAYMKRFYPHIACAFLPLAGNELLFHGAEGMPAQDSLEAEEERAGLLFEQWRRRKYPLVFTANYVPVSNIDRQLMEMEPEYREFYYEIIQAFIEHPNQDLLSCIELYLKREMPDLNDAQLCEGMHTMPVVDLWIRTYFREKTVRILAEGGVRVHLFGKDWDQVSCSHPQNLVSAGHMVSSADCVQAISQAHIALNTMPWFKDGAHDRIFTAMLQGAAALTDDSRYLREQFGHMDTIAYYGLQNLEALPQQVTELLKDPQRLFELSCRGKAVAKKLHMWKHRAEILKEYV